MSFLQVLRTSWGHRSPTTDTRLPASLHSNEVTYNGQSTGLQSPVIFEEGFLGDCHGWPASSHTLSSDTIQPMSEFNNLQAEALGVLDPNWSLNLNNLTAMPVQVSPAALCTQADPSGMLRFEITSRGSTLPGHKELNPMASKAYLQHTATPSGTHQCLSLVVDLSLITS